jgi:hypothetical protein
MLNEIIYTRCGTGRDILKKGAAIANEGYKCHSCSDALFNDGSVLDFQFLRTIAGVAHPFSEPDFVDDAYLYYVPEQGKPLFQNFHPIPNSKGRAGNFVSQIFVGDPDSYPCEAFGGEDWDAKLKTEDYYYGFRENAPPFLPQRGAPLSPGNINFETAGRFIAQGRAELLKKAIWFLFSQYALSTGERKYLIVKDTTENIKLWIAAMEYAFPPQIACTIPFATRMAEAAATGGTKGNRYFIGADGLSTATLEENTEKRLKAMIVGIDLKDQAANTLRVLPAYPYCLLDGTQKTVSFNTDDSIHEDYYNLVTEFDENHRRFIDFLSHIPELKISADIIKLCGVFKYLYLTPDTSWISAELIKHLELLMNYRAITADEEPVKKVVSHIDAVLLKDEPNGYKLFDFLRKIKAANEQELCVSALRVFQHKLDGGSSDIRQSLEYIKKQPFALAAVSRLVNDKALGKYQELIGRSEGAQAGRILEIYGEGLKFTNQKMGPGGIKLIGNVLERQIGANNREDSEKIIRNFIHSLANAATVIFPIAEKYKNDINKSDLIWTYVAGAYTADLPEKEFNEFCALMRERGFTAKIGNLLCAKITSSEDTDMLSKMIDTLDEVGLDERILLSLYDILDRKLPLVVKPDSPEDKLERKLLAHRPKNSNCSHSRCGVLLGNITRHSGQPKMIEKTIHDCFMTGVIPVNKDIIESDFYERLINETVPNLNGSAGHGMLLLLFDMPEPAMKEYILMYLDRAFKIINKKTSLFFDFIAILSYQYGSPGPLNEVSATCGKERFESTKAKIGSIIPLSYAEVFSEKLNSNLRASVAVKKNAKLLDLFEKISAAAKAEYEKNHGGTVLGALKKLFGGGTRK